MERSEESPREDATTYQVHEIDLDLIGEQLEVLGGQLAEAGKQLRGRALLPSISGTYVDDDGHSMTDDEVQRANDETRQAFRSTLRAIRRFRREYDRWERLTAEFALSEMDYTQRDAAHELGVAASTINRWAQHPLRVEEYR